MLPAFKDNRYYKIHGRLLFLIYLPRDIPDFGYFKNRWNELAKQNDLPGFFFIANTEDISDINDDIFSKYDAVSLCRIFAPWGIEQSKTLYVFRFITRYLSRIFGFAINVINYSKVIKLIDTPIYAEDRIYPNIIPNWDPSPRRGAGAYIYKNSTPELFKKHVKQILFRLLSKKDEDKVLFLRSWNEWGEGNYLEPELKWRKKYITALREALTEDHMNIAILARTIRLDGMSTHIIDLSKQLILKGHEVFIFTAGVQENKDEYHALEKRLLDTGAKIVKIIYPKNNKKKINYIFFLFLSSFQTFYKIKKLKIDVIHVHSLVLGFIPRMFGLKFVKTNHLRGMPKTILNRKATSEIAISKETYQESLQRFHYKEDELYLIHNGVDRYFAEVESSVMIEDFKRDKGIKDKVIIGFIGTICHRKGIDILIHAYSKLKNETRDKTQLIVIGEDQDFLSTIPISDTIRDNIVFYPFSNTKLFYSAIDIFVLPSRQEGFPLVILEAMLGNCCVVRSNTEGAYEQIENGKTGFLFQNENINDLVDILEKLIIDGTLREKIATAGKGYALHNFTADIMAEKTIEVYKKTKIQ
jgi:glycosyltransferase involved in cell wall biosynthesis